MTKRDKPYYKYEAIGSIDTLAKVLGLSKTKLIEYADHADDSYFHFSIYNQNKNKHRNISEPKYTLKKIQKNINSRIFSGVVFPEYLQGGIKSDENISRDYINNARIHCNVGTLINLDIKDFYPSIDYELVKDLYRNLFKFPNDVSNILAKLTTYNKTVPQGGCSSSYIANLILYNSEYKIVSELRSKNIRYTRLIDDMAISSEEVMSQHQCEYIIKKISALLHKYKLSLKNSKTTIHHRYSKFNDVQVTGLNVKHSQPKISGKDRKYIRLLVRICEKKSTFNRTDDTYHELWSTASGKVAKLTRLEYPAAKKLRERLSAVLPEYDQNRKNKLIIQVNALLKIKKEDKKHLKIINRINGIYYQLSILNRSDRCLSKKLRQNIYNHFGKLKTRDEVW